jgi:hypothetical protein
MQLRILQMAGNKFHASGPSRRALFPERGIFIFHSAGCIAGAFVSIRG